LSASIIMRGRDVAEALIIVDGVALGSAVVAKGERTLFRAAGAGEFRLLPVAEPVAERALLDFREDQ
jgi:hypothetical protein